MTDEECIAIAMLHGCTFHPSRFGRDIMWTVGDWDDDMHPIEVAEMEKTRTAAFPSRGALARAYCKHFGLLDKVTP